MIIINKNKNKNSNNNNNINLKINKSLKKTLVINNNIEKI